MTIIGNRLPTPYYDIKRTIKANVISKFSYSFPACYACTAIKVVSFNDLSLVIVSQRKFPRFYYLDFIFSILTSASTPSGLPQCIILGINQWKRKWEDFFWNWLRSTYSISSQIAMETPSHEFSFLSFLFLPNWYKLGETSFSFVS